MVPLYIFYTNPTLFAHPFPWVSCQASTRPFLPVACCVLYRFVGRSSLASIDFFTHYGHIFSVTHYHNHVLSFLSNVYLLVLNLRPSRLAASAPPSEVAMLKVSLFFSPGRPCLSPVPLLSTAARTVPDANEPESKEEHKAENSREVTTKDLITFRCMTIIIDQKYIK